MWCYSVSTKVFFETFCPVCPETFGLGRFGGPIIDETRGKFKTIPPGLKLLSAMATKT